MPRPPKTSSYAKTPARAVYHQSVRVATKSCYNADMAPHCILVHISRSEHRVLDPNDVYFLRAGGGETENDGAELELGDPRADTSVILMIGVN